MKPYGADFFRLTDLAEHGHLGFPEGLTFCCPVHPESFPMQILLLFKKKKYISSYCQHSPGWQAALLEYCDPTRRPHLPGASRRQGNLVTARTWPRARRIAANSARLPWRGVGLFSTAGAGPSPAEATFPKQHPTGPSSLPEVPGSTVLSSQQRWETVTYLNG